jgi:hypothetical protein
MTKLVDEEQKKMNIKLIQSQKDKLTKWYIINLTD